MVKRNAAAAAMAAASMMPAPASATEPFYFHKADIDRATFVADYAACEELAGSVRAPRYDVYSANIYATAAGSLFAGFFGSRERRHMSDNVLRTCRTDRGYRRVEASPEIRRELGRLPEKERVDRLFALAALPDPAGKLLPR